MRKREQAWKRFRSNPSVLLEDKYQKVWNSVIKDVRQAKARFEVQFADNIKEDSKSFFAYVTSISRNRVEIGTLKDRDGIIVTDDEGIGNVLNNSFAEVFTK